MTPQDLKITPYPKKIFAVSVILSCVVFLSLLLHSYLSYQTNRDLSMRGLRIEQLKGVITHLDEVLTMSASQAAATGEPRWETRYRSFEPHLDEAIKEAASLLPLDISRKFSNETDAVNVRSVEMEHRAFDLIRAGNPKVAYALLSGDAYQNQKQIYAQGVTLLKDALTEESTAYFKNWRATVLVYLIAGVIVLIFLITSAVIGFLSANKWEKSLKQSRSDLLSRTEELDQTNKKLDQRVKERTAELESSRLAALNMMEDAVEAQKKAEAAMNDLTRETAAHQKTGEQLIQAQKLDSIGRLAGGIAHDFNNILTVINGYAELSLSTLPSGDPSRPTFDEILKAGRRAAALTSQLLAFSRKQIIRPAIMDLNDIINNIDKMLRRLVTENILFTTVLAPNLGFINADVIQIEQIFINLIVNARDAMPNGGKIVIETQNVVITEKDASQHTEISPGEYIRLTVSDTGCGMSEEIRSRIFEPFFTTKETGKGTGLGLATCYGIVRQMGGKIACYSELNHGTSFKVYLPRAENKTAGSSVLTKIEPQTMPRGNEIVLLVEDESGVRQFSVQILKQQGYTVLEAVNGKDGLRLAQERQGKTIDLLFTDVIMPKMNGKDLADSVRELFPQIKVLFTSGYTEDAIVHHGVLHADVQFIAKPFSPADLALKVRETLDS